MATIGVLALQGAIDEHIRCLKKTGAETVHIKQPEQLNDVDGLVLPGGESTTVHRLMERYDFIEPIKQFSQEGKPIFGTCAGLILMAEDAPLALMNMKVKRNAFGRQQESFETLLHVDGVGEDVVAVFIRAPLITEVGEDVEVLSKYNGQIVAARQNHLLVSAFHPELTEDTRFHRYFIKIVKESKNDDN